MKKDFNHKKNIIMLGPALSATSGISNVVNNWIEVGLAENVNLQYISTLKNYVPGRYIRKFCEVLISLFLLTRNMSSCDLVHFHFSSGMSFYRKLILFILTKLMKKKTIVHLHASDFHVFYNKSRRIIRRMIEVFIDSSDGVVVLSRSWQTFVETISKNRRIFIVPNGANLAQYGNKISNKDRINITFMGRLGKRKGVYDLLEAFKMISSEFPHAHLILGGDGDLSGVRARIDESRYSQNIHILGWVLGTNKIRVFRECDIYALPSYNEGLPGSILEAMAVGVPIIATPVGGIPEAVIDNRNGFLISPGDVKELAARLRRLCSDRALRSRMGRESRKIISKRFNIEVILSDLLKIYDEVLES